MPKGVRVSSAVDVDDPPGATRPDAGPGRRAGDLVRALARGIGQTLITVGLLALLFVVYELWVTDILAGRQQQQLSEEIQEQWADDPTVTTPGAPAAPAPPAPLDVSLGQPFAVLHIPRLGEEWERVVVEGTAQVQLARGPGHYIGTALPGEHGNFAVAGHRVGRGGPFLDLDRLVPADAIVVETVDHWYVYRVLGEAATGSFDGDPSGVPGRQIVSPEDVAAIAPTPGAAPDVPASGAYLTLTTCHPKYSAQQRLIIHARLDGEPVSKATAPDGPPALVG